ncbi:MAG: MarR family transcriptional regulator [bacterium]|nr:MarR family transcriptional regulator [bacterium]
MNPFESDIYDHTALAIALPALLIAVGELTVRAGEKLIFGQFGLTHPQYVVLATVNVYPAPPTITDVKSSLFMVRSAANMTQLIDQLEEMGHLRRIASPTDRRASLLEITESGRETIASVDELYVRTMQEICRDYPDDELRGAVLTLRRFCGDAARVIGFEMRNPRLQ